MGLIKAGVGALGGTLADQWKEFFYCDSISKDILVVKGQKRISGRSSNTRGNDNIKHKRIGCAEFVIHYLLGVEIIDSLILSGVAAVAETLADSQKRLLNALAEAAGEN